jgi:hypothetical protein
MAIPRVKTTYSLPVDTVAALDPKAAVAVRAGAARATTNPADFRRLTPAGLQLADAAD